MVVYLEMFSDEYDDNRCYLTLRDLMHTIEVEKSCEPYGIGDLDLPIAVSEKTSGVNKPYSNNDEMVYAVRLSRYINKKQDFDGWIIEGLTQHEIEEMIEK